MQGDEVQACCSLRGFSESPTPSDSNIQLGKTLSLAPRTGGEKPLPCWRGEIPTHQPWGWEAPGKEILTVERMESCISEALFDINLLEAHLSG